MQPLIRLENISKDYSRLRALDCVTLDIPAGVTGLLGPNGAGKTTLIKVLLGLVRISGGTGHVWGMSLAKRLARYGDGEGICPRMTATSRGSAASRCCNTWCDFRASVRSKGCVAHTRSSTIVVSARNATAT